MPINGVQASAGKQPTTPTIGVPTDGGTGTSVLVPFTPSTYIGKGTITYTATSSPGSITSTSATSPITVTGLTTGTSYQFTVTGTTNYGVSSLASAASLSVTPVTPTSFDSIARFTGNNTTASYTFSSIPSTYKSLQIRVNALANGGGALRMRLNSDTGNNYWWHKVYGYNGTPSAGNSGSYTNTINVQGSAMGLGNTYPTVAIIDLIDYTSTSKNKTVKASSGIDSNNATFSEVSIGSGLWTNTAAVTSITIYCSGANFEAGSSIALYGVK